MQKRYGVLLLLVGWLLYTQVYLRPSSSGVGPMPQPTGEPVQTALEPVEKLTFEADGKTYRVEKTHRYEVVGQVLSASRYTLTFASDLYDYDLGLIWGPRMEDLLEKYKFYQDGRWLFWRSKTQVSDEERAYITAHISNNHVIPAHGRRNLALAFGKVRPGQTVRIKGALVTVYGPDGQEVARSSVSRADSGNGACEVVWVEELQIDRKIYR